MGTSFVDKARISVHAGKGGDGAVAFHREKYVAAGGPDGGDGGRGGSVIFVADDNMSTLMDFRYKRKYVAGNGANGQGKRCYGKDGESLYIKVPRGTIIRDTETGAIMHDMSSGENFVAAKGGRGGWGNMHFATPTRQVPRFAKPGLPGESHDITLELKLLADVGLVGFPNVGKFLRHIDRCRLLIHLVDVSGSEGRDPVEDFDAINAELREYNPELAERPQIVAANKCDLLGDDRENIDRLRARAEELGYEFFEMSAVTHEGTRELIKECARRLAELPPIASYEADYVPPEPVIDTSEELEIRQFDDMWIVEGPWLQRLVATINFGDYESRMYFDKVLREAGVFERMEKMGVRDGDTVSMYDLMFEYKD